jgi:multidrug efflux pump subunit AcrA (membrane-fusion protein)
MSGLGTRSLFRERASPENQVRESLDERVPVVRGPAWLGLLLAALAIAGLIAWAASGHVEVSVDGTGVVMSSPLPEEVQAPVAGTVVEAPPAAGSAVRAGEVLARLAAGGRTPTVVRAVSSGTIVDSSVAAGSVVQRGMTMARVEPEGSARRAYLYVPLDDGSGLRPGQEALVTPAGPQQQQDSFIEGHVVSVQDVTATPERLDQVLGPTLGPRTASGPPVIEVVVRLSATSTAHAVIPLRLQTPLSGRIIVSQSSLFDLTF